MTAQELDQILANFAVRVRNDTLETAAKVAKMFDSPDEAVRRILQLKGEEKRI